MKIGSYLAAFSLASVSILGLGSAAFAEFRVNTGAIGDYAYELWRSDNGREFTLQVWEREDYPENGMIREHGRFESTREALDYFDCYYGENQSACEQLARY
ncbi:MAG: hypothetical protein AAGF01_13410 [Cyanobacteria bacterium P01_G01_bin.38]